MSGKSKSRRQRRRAIEKMRVAAQPLTNAAVAEEIEIVNATDAPEIVEAAPLVRRPFEKQIFRLKGGFKVTIVGPTAFEDDIDIDFTRGSSLVIQTAEGRTAREIAEPAIRPVQQRAPRATMPDEGESNRHLFERGKTSKILNDPPPYAAEAAHSNVETVITPRAPRDRTGAQKRALGLVSAETSAGPVNIDTGLSLESLRSGS